MARYWLMESKGGLLGPVTLEVLRDLLEKGRIDARSRVSRDGQNFAPLVTVPELGALLEPGRGQAQADSEQARALAVRTDLQRFRTMEVHELFGVPKGASAQACRTGFLALAKTYHPGRLSRSVHPDLLRACMETFMYLQERMAQVEPHSWTAPAPRPSTGSAAAAASPPTSSARAAPPPTPRPPPTARPPGNPWKVTRDANGKLEATLEVTPSGLGPFVKHPLVNFASGGVFIETDELLPLGTRVELRIRFAQASREVKVRAVVVLEVAGHLRNQTPGFGLRLDGLSADDRSFLQEQLQTPPTPAEDRSPTKSPRRT